MTSSRDRLINSIDENTWATREAARTTAEATAAAAKSHAADAARIAEEIGGAAFAAEYHAEQQATEARRRSAGDRAYAQAQRSHDTNMRRTYLEYREILRRNKPDLAEQDIELSFARAIEEDEARARTEYDALIADRRADEARDVAAYQAADKEYKRLRPLTVSSSFPTNLGFVLVAFIALAIYTADGLGHAIAIGVVPFLLGAFHVYRYKQAGAALPQTMKQHALTAFKGLPVATLIAGLLCMHSGPESFGNAAVILCYAGGIYALYHRKSYYGLESRAASLQAQRTAGLRAIELTDSMSFEEFWQQRMARK